MDAEELGRRLRVAREARGLSQQAAANALGLPRTAITQIEAGNRSVSTLELTKLAELYIRPVLYFLQEGARDEDEDVLVALHRVAPGLESDPVTHEEVTRCVSLCREGVALERFLGSASRSGPPNYEARLPRSSWEAVVQGEQTAVEERQRLGIGNAPIADVSELIASQGIWGLGRRAAQRDVGGVSAPPQHRIRHSRQFIPPERAQTLLLCARIRSRAARPQPQHRGFEHRQLVGNGRAAGKRVRGSVSHAEERRLRSVAKSRQGASKPPGTDHLRCRQRRPHRRGVSLAGAFRNVSITRTSRCLLTASE